MKTGAHVRSRTGTSREKYRAGFRAVDHMGIVASARARRRLRWKESNLLDDRLTAGCLTIRLQRKESRAARGRVTARARARDWRQVFREQRARTGRDAMVPGEGFEPSFLVSETSVLPARRSRNAERRPRARAVGTREVGREGLEPSPLGLKARCSAVELASRAQTIAFVWRPKPQIPSLRNMIEHRGQSSIDCHGHPGGVRDVDTSVELFVGGAGGLSSGPDRRCGAPNGSRHRSLGAGNEKSRLGEPGRPSSRLLWGERHEDR